MGKIESFLISEKVVHIVTTSRYIGTYTELGYGYMSHRSKLLNEHVSNYSRNAPCCIKRKLESNFTKQNPS
jgi:hypothetical protein